MEIKERDEYGRVQKDFVPSRKTEEVIEELRKLKVTDEQLQEIENQLLVRDALIGNIGMQLTEEKLKSMQKDMLISNLGQEIPKIKLDIMLLKGGE